MGVTCTNSKFRRGEAGQFVANNLLAICIDKRTKVKIMNAILSVLAVYAIVLLPIYYFKNKKK